MGELYIDKKDYHFFPFNKFFIEKMEKGYNSDILSDREKLIMEYLSKTVLSGVRPTELYILQLLITNSSISFSSVREGLHNQFDLDVTEWEISEATKVLQGGFVKNDQERKKYSIMEIVKN